MNNHEITSVAAGNYLDRIGFPEHPVFSHLLGGWTSDAQELTIDALAFWDNGEIDLYTQIGNSSFELFLEIDGHGNPFQVMQGGQLFVCQSPDPHNDQASYPINRLLTHRQVEQAGWTAFEMGKTIEVDISGDLFDDYVSYVKTA